MNSYKRFRNRWNVNELLQLQREFELLEMSIDDIALKHQRTPNAIMFKLDQEGFADYNVLYSNYHGSNLMSKMNSTLEIKPNLDNSESEETFTVSSHLENKLFQLEKQVQLLTQMLKKQTVNNAFA
jgi:hypothetical protein